MSDEDGIYRLIYVSRNALLGEIHHVEQEVWRILDASRRNNSLVGVTGALLFSAGCFAQVLEGSPAAIQDTFERIQCDPRHDGPVVLEAGPAGRREFAGWSMAYAGRVENDRARFEMLSGTGSVPNDAGGAQVLELLRSLVLRAAPVLP